MGGKLKKLASRSDLMNISIVHGKERIKFNLFEELVVNENKLNDELKNQPSYFAYLSTLSIKLKRISEDKKQQMNKIYHQIFVKYKSQSNENTGRVNSNEYSEALTIIEPEYQKALKDYNKAEEDFGIIKAAVDAFNQRSNLIQTISANIRRNND
jgi:hypothetical protein